MSAARASQRVGVVVLNWNRRADTLACLKSLTESDWPSIVTIVVDNASEEPIEAVVARHFPDAVFIRNQRNLGFAGGMNVGLRRALALHCDFVLLLNNDTTADPKMVRLLVEAAQQRPDAGIVSPLVLDGAERHIVTSAGRKFDPRRGHPGRSLLSGERRSDGLRGVREIDASSGEAMLVSAEAAHEVGGLAEELYLRLEDIDWSLRMRAAGRRNYVVLDALLWHAVSASSGGEHSPLNAYYHTRNILHVCNLHAPMRGTRRLIREAEVVVANVVHARRGRAPAENARAAIAGWRDYRRGLTGAREPA